MCRSLIAGGWAKSFRATFQANRAGICLVAIPRDKITELELTSRSDGFADTRLKWTPANGEKNSCRYTPAWRAEAIGGLVLDERATAPGRDRWLQP
jgi:hypothetical protein